MRRSKSGRWFSAASLAMAFVSLAVALGVFGPLGILMGMAAVVKRERYLGMLGVVASAVLAVTGLHRGGVGGLGAEYPRTVRRRGFLTRRA